MPKKLTQQQKEARRLEKARKKEAAALKKAQKQEARMAKQKAAAEKKAAAALKKAEKQAARKAKQKAAAERKAMQRIVKGWRKVVKEEITLAKKECKRISKMATKAFKNFKPGFDMRKAMREKIQLRTETGGTWNLIAAIQQMLTLPYYKNEAAASGAVHNTARHEDALAKVLEENGFLRYPLASKLNRTATMKWKQHPELSKEIPDGTFIEQPFGTHNAPDFIVKVNNNFVLFLEAKSSATALHPTYNSGGVKQDLLYVFCAKKTNQTTIFKGSSVITLEQQRLIDEHIIEARKRDEELNRQLAAIDPNHRGISYYTRPMIIQSGGASYTNYFTHKQRHQAENHALDWLKKKCKN